MMVELKVPTEFQLTVDGDLNRRKGIIVGNDQDGDDSVINALELHKMVSSFAYQSNGSYTAIWAPKTTQKSGQILELMAGNRGASGIDGLFSTAVGFAAGHNKRVVCVLGDVSFVYDTNGLALLKQRISRKQMTIIVINNHGGAIFSLLPIANTDDEKTLNQYFYTSHNVGIHNLCSAHGALPKIIKTGFSAINLIYFFTAGADEVKCWKIRRLSKAPQAAGAIHTDFERGFICAEDLKEHGRESTVKVLLIWFGLAKKCSVTEEDCGQGEY